MKIASQLSSSDPGQGTKTLSSSASGTNFYEALTAAATPNAPGSGESGRVNPKQVLIAKPQAMEFKKKNTAADPSVNDAGSPLVSMPKPPIQTVAVQFPVALPVTLDDSTQALRPSPDQEPSGLGTDSGTNAVGGELPAAAVFNSSDPLETKAGRSIRIDPGVSNPIFMATGSPEAGFPVPKPSLADHSGDDLRAADTSDEDPSVAKVDSAGLADPRNVGADSESGAGSMAPPSVSPASEEPQALKISVGETLDIKNAAVPLKEGTLRTAGSPPSKIKVATSSLDVRGKVADGKDSEVSATNPTIATAFPVKAVEASETSSHGTPEPRTTFDAASLQANLQPLSDSPQRVSQALHGLSGSTRSSAQTAPAQTSSDSPMMQGVTNAQLTQSMRSSEMKLGIQSSEFGSISISTSLNHQAISAQISIDHAELGRALAVHLPAIEEKLGSAYGVQAKVELRESNNPSSSHDTGYSNSGQQSREQRQHERGGATGTQSIPFEQCANRSSFTAISAGASTSRLDIRI